MTIMDAVIAGNIEAVKHLIDPTKDHAVELGHAVLNQTNPNRYEIVQLLIPVSNVLDGHNIAMMDLLYDVSDPYAALAYMKNHTDEPRWRCLSDHIQMREAQHEKAVLQQSILTSAPTHPARKM